jgi:coenzyme F420-0:L-glutamate ligase/coenzyme F420-1:gamma-L-glutamate ligase
VGPLTLLPITGVPEVREGDDLAALIVRCAAASGSALEDGDVVVVSSKVVSKALGLWAFGDRDAVVTAESTRVVAERLSGGRVTQIVESAAGPVMAAAGVDASNTGGRDGLLLLPRDPDGEADRLRSALLAATGLSRIGVIISDTAGRPWRAGQTDFALGAAGVSLVDDLRGGVDADGQPLVVTTRAVGDELAAAAELVKGKAEAIPAAIARGSGLAVEGRGPSARSLLRAGPHDWFEYGSAEAVRASLGIEPGTEAARGVGLAAAGVEDPATRVGRAIAVALHAVPDAAVSSGGDRVTVHAADGYTLGLAAARLQAALWGEGLAVELPQSADALELELPLRERRQPAPPHH